MYPAFQFTKWRLVNLCIHLVVLGSCVIFLAVLGPNVPLILLTVACLLTGGASILEAYLRGRKAPDQRP